jgi:glutaredoxin 2
VKLYIYEHCPFSTRARVIFGLKKIPVELEVIMEGDAETPTRLVGRKVVPILLKDDGTAMAESIDIVRYVDSLVGPAVLADPPRANIAAWCEQARPVVSRLSIPRMVRSSFKENSTEVSQKAYRDRETKAFGDLDALIAESPSLLVQVDELLHRLEPLIENWSARSETDLVLFSHLRALSIVKGLKFGPKVDAFVDDMVNGSAVELLRDRAI